MNRIGGKSNSGEGGEDPRRFTRDEDGDWRNSASSKLHQVVLVFPHIFGQCTRDSNQNGAGAKPGEGGQLPGPKVNPYIASVRNSTLMSGWFHHRHTMIFTRLKICTTHLRFEKCQSRSSRECQVGFWSWCWNHCCWCCKSQSRCILISGYDGGTGASPLTSLKHAGLPWELGIAEAQQTLV